MCVPVAASTGRRCLRSAASGDLKVPKTRTIIYGSRVLQSSDHVSGMICPMRVSPTMHTWSVPEQTRDNTISFGLRDVTWRFRDRLGR